MAHRLALEADDVFIGFASICRMLPKSIWYAKGSVKNINLLQVNGDKDDVVPMYVNNTVSQLR